MKTLLASCVSIATMCLACLVASASLAQENNRSERRDGSDVERVRKNETNTPLIPLHKIVADIKSQPPYNAMTYLGGARYYPEITCYKLKFLDDNRVIVVYINARDGQVMGHGR